tara:strand:+ start:1508 stop:1900 length:393 start_codon:yes stop_codon:yes gene_type:complete
MLLTGLVWFYMYFLRLKYILEHRIAYDKLETPEQASAHLPIATNKPSNNLKNLFELPVLFYAICMMTLVLKLQDIGLMYLAWGFVIGRFLHSFFHCFTYSILSRFYSYVFSSLLLWSMLIRLVYLYIDHL